MGSETSIPSPYHLLTIYHVSGTVLDIFTYYFI